MEDMVLIDGYKDAIIGMAEVWNVDGSKTFRAVYSGERIVEILMGEGFTWEEAVEHIDFNIEGAYVGPNTPVVVWDWPKL